MAHEKMASNVEELEAIRVMLLGRLEKLDKDKGMLETEVKLVEAKIERLKAGHKE